MKATRRKIVCVGITSDDTFAYTVHRARELARNEPIVVDLATFRLGARIHYDAYCNEWKLESPESSVRLTPSLNAYQRFIPIAQDLGAPDDERVPLLLAERAVEIILDSDFFRCVINPLCAGWQNGIRTLHYAFLQKIGFSVPPYIVTNDPKAVEAFRRRHGRLHVKSVSHHRTIGRELTAERLSESREQIRVTPCLIQKLIIGDDVRIHVVDRACFAILIRSDAADYRYARGSVDFTPTDVPANVAKKCVRATAALGLRFAGIDMKICETTGRWYCLEVNPMPGYSGYDVRMSGIISEALIEALESA